MKKVLALGASNSSKSINKLFATTVANATEGTEVIVADLNDYNLPLYGPDLEAEIGGVHPEALKFDELLGSVDGIVISLAEYNGSYTTAFKNVFDWISRIDMKTTFKNKPMLVLATSPGGRGGQGVLGAFKMAAPHFGANIIAEYSLPSFHDNFKDGEIVNEETLAGYIKQFQEAL